MWNIVTVIENLTIIEDNGYDWGSVTTVFLREKMPQLADIVHFDPEVDMYCA